jgi:hypothetical protein
MKEYNMKSLKKILPLAFLMLMTVQCDLITDDYLDSPNFVTPENVDPNYLLNNIQIATRNVYNNASGLAGQMTRMRHMSGSTYGNAFASANFNTFYQNAYSNALIDIQALIPIAEDTGLDFHLGVAKTLQGYILLTLVDMFGDVPYSQALDAFEFNPGLDSGDSIYNAAIGILDEAVAHLEGIESLAFAGDDLYFPGTSGLAKVEAWIRTANTIKLKAYLNIGNSSGINDLIAEDMLIVNNDQNFIFGYSSNDTNPDARHPNFIDSYEDLPTLGNYMSVSYLNMLMNDKPQRDPRLRYYFYRQTLEDPTSTSLNSCIGVEPPSHFQDDDPWCLLGDGYWGRNHLIDDGIPPDTPLRTTFGVYPAGGVFDADQGVSVTNDMGYAGAGIQPILLASFTHFMLAEAAESLGTTGDAESYLETAIQLSLEFVGDFGESSASAEDPDGDFPRANDPDVIDTYINQAMADYDGLRTIAKEYYLALWPNGIESYNLMRRTGYPNREDNLQPARSASPGNWYRTFSYPAVMIERNSNVSAKPSNLVSTFWDPRPESEEYDF